MAPAIAAPPTTIVMRPSVFTVDHEVSGFSTMTLPPLFLSASSSACVLSVMFTIRRCTVVSFSASVKCLV